MKKTWKEMKEKWGPLVLGACVVVAFYLIISHLGIVWNSIHAVIRAISPIIVGCGVAYILNPFAKFYDRILFGKMNNRKASWILSVVLSIIILLVLVALVLYTLIPELIGSITNFANNIESYLASLNRLIDSINLPNSDLIDSIKELISNEGNLISRGVQFLLDNVSAIIQRSSNFTRGTVDTVIGFILAIYFLSGKQKLKSWIKQGLWLLCKEKHYENVINIGKRFNSIFAKYITCELIDAIIVGVVNYIFMLILNMPYSIMVSIVVGVANLVPTFGPIVGAVIGGLVLLLANPINALWFIIFTIILQTIDGYWIKPRLFGDVLNVSGVLILISIIVFGRIFGVIGIFLSIPLAALILYIVQEFLVPKLDRRKFGEPSQTAGADGQKADSVPDRLRGSR